MGLSVPVPPLGVQIRVGGELPGCLGMWAGLAQKVEGLWLSGADLDGAETKEGEQGGCLYNHFGTPRPREGRRLANATQKQS